MALKVRLSRGGAKKRPFYRIVVAEATAPRDGRFVEKLGTYDPLLDQKNEMRWVVDEARMAHWLSVGAKPTARVARFLGERGLAPAPVFRPSPVKSAPGKKAMERQEAAARARNEGAPSS